MLKRVLLIAVLAVSSLGFAASVKAEEIESSIETVVSDPREFDGKVVSVEGVIEKMKHFTTPSGDRYTLFNLIDDEKNAVGVYTKGHLKIAKGDRVRVMGKFKKERRYALLKFKNVIKAKTVEDVAGKDDRIAKTD